MRKLAFISSAVAALAVLASSAPARATPPLLETFEFSTSDAQDCGGFEVLVKRDFTGTQTTFFDKAGDPIRVQVVAHMQGTADNSKTGKRLFLRGNLLVVIDLVTGSQAFNGQVFMTNEKGAGSVIQDTGRFLVDADGNVLLEAGPHDVVDTNGEIFCTALA